MLNLTAYRIADLQQIVGVLSMGKQAGMTIDELIVSLSTTIEQSVAVRPAQSVPPPVPDKPPPVECPSCGKSLLEVWPQASFLAGGRVVGCRSCHYSKFGEI